VTGKTGSSCLVTENRAAWGTAPETSEIRTAGSAADAKVVAVMVSESKMIHLMVAFTDYMSLANTDL
jgi:hypothetical protein